MREFRSSSSACVMMLVNSVLMLVSVLRKACGVILICRPLGILLSDWHCCRKVRWCSVLVRFDKAL